MATEMGGGEPDTASACRLLRCRHPLALLHKQGDCFDAAAVERDAGEWENGLGAGHLLTPQYQDYYKHFRHRQPTAKAGWTILIYDLRPQSPVRAGD